MDYQKLFLSKRNTSDEYLCAVNSYEHGLQVLEKLVQKFNLCAKYCGADDITNACFGYAVKQCKGACLGKEDAEMYNQRVTKAIESLSYSEKNFIIVGEGRSNSEKSIVQVEKGKYKGFGFVETENTNIDLESIKASIKFKNDSRDVNQIIQRFLKNSKRENIILY
jgi:DNA polymerase-3 subunit epsilon